MYIVYTANLKDVASITWAKSVSHEFQGHCFRAKGPRVQKHSSAQLPLMGNEHTEFGDCATLIPWTQAMAKEFQGQGHSFKVKDHRVTKTCQCTPIPHW